MTPPALGGSRSTSTRTDAKAPQSAVTADGSPAADSPGPNAIPLRPVLRNRPRSESTDAILQSHQYEHPPPVQPFTREERLALAGYRGIAAYRELTVTEERVDDVSK